MKRREFITLFGGAAASWTVAARAQPGGVRRIGVLIPVGADSTSAQAYLAAFQTGGSLQTARYLF
jgi:hypothetical protein